MDLAMELLVDPIPNVRLHVTPLLPALKQTIRLPEDVEQLVRHTPVRAVHHDVVQGPGFGVSLCSTLKQHVLDNIDLFIPEQPVLECAIPPPNSSTSCSHLMQLLLRPMTRTTSAWQATPASRVHCRSC